MKRPSHILWDFNGTILDDVQTGVASMNALLKQNGMDKKLDTESYKEVFGFPVKDYYERLGFDFSKKSFDVLAVEWVDLYNDAVGSAPLCPNVVPALEYVRSRGVKQLILTASEVSMVQTQLDKFGISGYFDAIIGQDNIKAYGKTEAARKWFALEKPENAVLIGDTPHDAETAEYLGIGCLLVTCGHQSEARLRKYGKVFSDPLQAVKYLL